MITKIITGGQTGADQAGLDVAIELGIPHGGWIPKGRKNEDGVLPDKYQLQEMPTANYAKRTEQNIIASHGTLIFSHGHLKGGSALTRKLAREHKRPCLHIDLDKMGIFDAPIKIHNWLYGYQIEILNIAGSRRSKDPSIYDATCLILREALTLGERSNPLPDPEEIGRFCPQTVEEAVDFLLAGLPLKEKVTISRIEKGELSILQPTIGQYIRNEFGLWSGNDPLMMSCHSAMKESGDQNPFHEDDASGIIISELWRRLKRNPPLRLIK